MVCLVALLRTATGTGAQARDGVAATAVAAKPDGVAEYLGVGLANLVNLLNPRLIVLGGLLRELYPVIEERVERAISAAALQVPHEQVTFAVPELGGDAVLLGAAEVAMQDLLTDRAKVLG